MNNDISKNIALIIANVCDMDLQNINSTILIEEVIKDSMLFVQVIVDIEEKFGIEFAIDDFVSDRFRTVLDIEKRVAELLKM